MWGADILRWKKSDHGLMSHLVALLLIPDALMAVSTAVLLFRINEKWTCSAQLQGIPSGKGRLLSVNRESSWTKCTSSWVSGHVLSLGVCCQLLDYVLHGVSQNSPGSSGSEGGILRTATPWASQHGKSDSGGGQSQLKGRSHMYKVIISSCSMGLCTSLSSIHQDIKGFITHPLVNQCCCSLPLVNVVKWSGFEAPACIPLLSSSQTTLCLTSTLCSWSYFWRTVLGTK